MMPPVPTMLESITEDQVEPGGGDRAERSAARDSGSEHKPGGSGPGAAECCLCTVLARP